jgi:hypothetical protein
MYTIERQRIEEDDKKRKAINQSLRDNGGWICFGCSRVNSVDAIKCELCSTAKPFAFRLGHHHHIHHDEQQNRTVSMQSSDAAHHYQLNTKKNKQLSSNNGAEGRNRSEVSLEENRGTCCNDESYQSYAEDSMNWIADTVSGIMTSSKPTHKQVTKSVERNDLELTTYSNTPNHPVLMSVFIGIM